MNFSDVERALRAVRNKAAVSGVPETIERKIDETLRSLPERRMKERRGLASRIVAMSSAVAIAVGSALAAAALSPQAEAALRQLPLVGSIFAQAHDWGLRQTDTAGLTTAVGLTDTSNGIRLTLEKAVYDGIRFSAAFAMKTADGRKVEPAPGEYGITMDYAWNIKGESERYAGKGSAVEDESGKLVGFIDVTPPERLPDSFVVGLKVSKIGDRTGDWSFSFPISSLKENSKIIEPIAASSNRQISISVREVKLTPMTTEIEFDYSQPSGVNLPIGFELMDGDGIALELISSQSGMTTEAGSAVSRGSWKIQFGPAPENTTKLFFRPYFYQNAPKAEYRIRMNEMPSEDAPLVLPQGESGELRITEVILEADKTVVRYDVIGSSPQEQANMLSLETADGADVPRNPMKAEKTLDPFKRRYEKEFAPVPKDAELVFITQPAKTREFLNELELEFAIPGSV
ncbi:MULTISPECIES: DUF4179 domain-containing protein [Cohnella]|uniref:DUF4179 domain-containing protein n=1 Tax=Cohnella TaxID=329857 RepID=UPI0009BB5476|nr:MULTISPECIES: DUF4179 domain-containing protein [Cohnella]MBN2984954.1 DUF4179 domain-containing protein [Cohnella algarum]